MYNISMNKIKTVPKTLQQLQKNIDEFFKEHKPSKDNVISPRLFRVYIGVNKSTFANWKTMETRKNFWNLIKTYQDILLAFIEQRTLDLSVVDKEDRVNIIGLLNTLRAYDAEQYVPELRNKEQTQAQAPIQFILDNKGPNVIKEHVKAQIKEK